MEERKNPLISNLDSINLMVDLCSSNDNEVESNEIFFNIISTV